jgi:hypothetical protein
MVEMSGHEQLSAVTAVAQACILANRADLIVPAIEQAWWNGQAAATTWLANFIEAERTAPAATTTTAPANSGSTLAQRDPLAAAIEKRMRAMYPASPSAVGKSG